LHNAAAHILPFSCFFFFIVCRAAGGAMLCMQKSLLLAISIQQSSWDDRTPHDFLFRFTDGPTAAAALVFARLFTFFFHIINYSPSVRRHRHRLLPLDY